MKGGVLRRSDLETQPQEMPLRIMCLAQVPFGQSVEPLQTPGLP